MYKRSAYSALPLLLVSIVGVIILLFVVIKFVSVFNQGGDVLHRTPYFVASSLEAFTNLITSYQSAYLDTHKNAAIGALALGATILLSPHLPGIGRRAASKLEEKGILTLKKEADKSILRRVGSALEKDTWKKVSKYVGGSLVLGGATLLSIYGGLGLVSKIANEIKVNVLKFTPTIVCDVKIEETSGDKLKMTRDCYYHFTTYLPDTINRAIPSLNVIEKNICKDLKSNLLPEYYTILEGKYGECKNDDPKWVAIYTSYSIAKLVTTSIREMGIVFLVRGSGTNVQLYKIRIYGLDKFSGKGVDDLLDLNEINMLCWLKAIKYKCNPKNETCISYYDILYPKKSTEYVPDDYYNKGICNMLNIQPDSVYTKNENSLDYLHVIPTIFCGETNYIMDSNGNLLDIEDLNVKTYERVSSINLVNVNCPPSTKPHKAHGFVALISDSGAGSIEVWATRGVIYYDTITP